MQSPQSPLVLLLYVLGVIFAVPSFKILWNAAAFVIGSRHKLDSVVDDVSKVRSDLERHIEETRQDRHVRRGREQMYEISLTLVETDVNALQHHSKLPVRDYPSRLGAGE